MESMLGPMSTGQPSGRRHFMQRQDVALPPDEGWQWTDEWQVQRPITIPLSAVLSLLLSRPP